MGCQPASTCPPKVSIQAILRCKKWTLWPNRSTSSECRDDRDITLLASIVNLAPSEVTGSRLLQSNLLYVLLPSWWHVILLRYCLATTASLSWASHCFHAWCVWFAIVCLSSSCLCATRPWCRQRSTADSKCSERSAARQSLQRTGCTRCTQCSTRPVGRTVDVALRRTTGGSIGSALGVAVCSEHGKSG